MSYEQFAAWRDRPEPMRPLLSVVIPAYNETARIVPTIASIASHLVERGLSFEIIVSDDGSTDGTPDRCRELELRNLIVLDPGFNRGKGAAVRDGVRAANGELILFTDADLSTPVEEIDRFISEILDADIVIGSRAMAGSDEGDKPFVRRLMSRLCRTTTARILGLDITDSQCGFKLFRRDAAHRVFALQRIDGFSFDAELLYLASREGLRVTEVPVRWIDAPGSKVDARKESLRFVRDLIAIRVSALMGRYRPGSIGNIEGGLRVAVVTAAPPSKATLTEYGLYLIEHLKDVDGVDEVIVLAEESDGIPPSGPGLTVEAGWRFDSPLSLYRLVRATRRHRPDAVLFNLHFTSFGTRRIPAALGLITPMVVRLFGTPTVVLLHNLVDTTDLDAAGYASSPLERRVLRSIGRILTRAILRVDHVGTTLPAYVDILRDDYRATNVSLTPHGAFRSAPASATIPPGPRRLLAFGKFGTYKRVDDLVTAYRLLLRDPVHQDVELIIAGTDAAVTPGYLAGVEATCTDLPGVHFAGYVAEQDVAGLFASATLTVFPYTATTGSSGPLHQAGSYSRAVVAPRIGDFIDQIEEEGFTAKSFEPGDPESLMASLQWLLARPDEIERMGAQNHAAAVGLPLADIAEWHAIHLKRVATA